MGVNTAARVKGKFRGGNGCGLRHQPGWAVVTNTITVRAQINRVVSIAVFVILTAVIR
jgi:hypothetical protein